MDPNQTPLDDKALDEVVRLTSDLIRRDTTNRGGGEGDEREAAEYVAAELAETGLEPAILEKAPRRTNVVARVEGTDPSAPALLVHGHLDVVPAAAEDWAVDPFSGEVRDGVVWGRGAVDMKNMVAMTLAAVRSWHRTGARPRRDIVLAFTSDEEDSARYGSEFLAEEHSELFAGCEAGVSEAGGYTFHDGRGNRLYPIGAGERGTAWLDVVAKGTAGHGSKVHPDNAVAHLSRALARISDHRWPVQLSPTVRAALRSLAEIYGTPFDEDDVDGFIARLGCERYLVEATVRNSSAPTVLDAGYKVNVIPGQARAMVDGRVVPGGTELFEATLDGLTGPNVDWSYHHREVPLTAPVDGPLFGAMRDSLLRFDPEGRVVPVCLSGGTDAKQFSRLGITGYGFSPLRFPEGFAFEKLFHGVDERVPVEALRFGVRVLDDFLRSA
ncbi:M20/M25/M40 family metallo-hydrolase [Salininema proteolyticum]|uniref:M20/M25/M40 family metallo-hydrolase n=1 Tax=Salininema proteolyticum TaxID=1607685 RepID=A0ABV8U4P2_9ACTN